MTWPSGHTSIIFIVIVKIFFFYFSLLSGAVWLIGLSFYVVKVLRPFYSSGLESPREVTLSILQMGLLIAALHNIYTQSKRFEKATPVSYFHQTIAWTIAGSYLYFDCLVSLEAVDSFSIVRFPHITFILLFN